MTKPTDRQIEAARTVILSARAHAAWMREELKLTYAHIERLTAAAEMGEQCNPSLDRQSLGWNPGDCITDPFVERVAAATIERCAQVMDARAAWWRANGNAQITVECEKSAAAIRALKDKT